MKDTIIPMAYAAMMFESTRRLFHSVPGADCLGFGKAASQEGATEALVQWISTGGSGASHDLPPVLILFDVFLQRLGNPTCRMG